LRVFQFGANLVHMEYRGIRYTIRRGIERRQYRAAIYPDGVEVPTNRVFGSPQDAEAYARRMISRWLAEQSANEKEQ
jgi:hypothetical protein